MLATALPNLALHAEAIHKNLDKRATLCAFDGDEDTASHIDGHLDALAMVIHFTKGVTTVEQAARKFDLGVSRKAPLTDRQKALIGITFVSAKIVMANDTAAVAVAAGDFFGDEELAEVAKELRDEITSAESVRSTLACEARKAGASLDDILNAFSADLQLVASSL